MNPELYERYLAKKAKKLGITVEELKAQGTSSPVSEPSVTSSNTEQTISQEPQQSVQVEPQYVQRTIQDQLASQENTIPQQQPYMAAVEELYFLAMPIDLESYVEHIEVLPVPIVEVLEISFVLYLTKSRMVQIQGKMSLELSILLL